MGFFFASPIQTIEWVHPRELQPNGWNPNYVMEQEMRSLINSIETFGWMQPIIINTEKLIIDGFHRYAIALSNEVVKAHWGDKVPCVVIPVNRAQAMMMTVRMNRAKGTHQGSLMAKLVTQLIEEEHVSREEVARGIGADLSEVDFLTRNNIMKSREVRTTPYSRAWRPRLNIRLKGKVDEKL